MQRFDSRRKNRLGLPKIPDTVSTLPLSLLMVHGATEGAVHE